MAPPCASRFIDLAATPHAGKHCELSAAADKSGLIIRGGFRLFARKSPLALLSPPMGRGNCQCVGPGGEGVEHVAADLAIGAAAARRNVKGMVCVLKELQGCEGTECAAERLELGKRGEGISRPLQEQHGNAHIEKMIGAIARRPPCRMQRKAEKGEAAPAGERCRGLGLRGHAAAEGFAAGDQWEARKQA